MLETALNKDTEQTKPGSARRHALLEPGNWWRVYLLGWLPVGLSYLIILGVFIQINGLTLVTTWTANILFPTVAGLGVSWIILNLLIHQTPKVQVAAHTIGAVMFATLWTMATFRLLQFLSGLMTGDWSAPNWPSAAIAWQLFQGLAIYFTITSATYAYWAMSMLLERTPGETVPSARARIYAKTSDGLTPLDVAEIAAARAIDGVTYLFVGGKKLESRMSLGELEAALPDALFLRVHRSTLVNLDQIRAIEPGGNGRKILHLKTNTSLETSRAGAAALKARMALV